MAYHGGYEKCAHLYDLFDDKENIQFFLHYAEEASKILDVGAGTGRIAIPIAEKGIKIHYVEPSPAMVQEFKRKISGMKNLERNITLTNSDASSFSLEKTFPACYLSGTFDHFLNDEERISALNNIHDHLVQKGKLIFDVFLGLMEDSSLHPAGMVKKGGREYKRFIETKILSQNILHTLLVYEIYENGKLIHKINQQSQAGITTREKVHKLLKKTGFEIENEYSDYKFNPFKKGEDLLIIEATKKSKF